MVSGNPLYLGKMSKSHVTYRILFDDSEPSCPYCLQVVEERDIVAYGPCGHGFHSHCTEIWSFLHDKECRKTGNTTPLNCPICRGPFPFVLRFNEGRPHARPEWEPDDTIESAMDRFIEFDRGMEEILGPGFEDNPISALIRVHTGAAREGDAVSTSTLLK